MEDEENTPVEDLEIHGIIGFDGSIISGLRVHPSKEYIIYPLGNKVCILNWETRQQDYLSGHTNLVSAIDVSRSGKYVASGQINHIGFKAWVIIWDFESRSILAKHEIHKVRVEAVGFSSDDKYVISLGGRDCGSVVVWDVFKNMPISGASATRGIQGEAYFVVATHKRGACFVTGGDNNMAVWEIDEPARSLRNIDVVVSKIKRIAYCMVIDDRDEIAYCGTSTGDILKVRLNFHHDVEILAPVKNPMMVGCLARMCRKALPPGMSDLYGNGVRSLFILPNGLLLVGAGDGIFEMVMEQPSTPVPKVGLQKVTFAKPMALPVLQMVKSTHVEGSITSIQMINAQDVLLGTTTCEIFKVSLNTFKPILITTCHVNAIYSVAFPIGFSEVFATASHEDVRVWNLPTMTEMLRIKVPNFVCSEVCFSHDGKSILTAWNDGVIRSFTPQTGRLIYAILNAHNKGVSCLTTTSHGRTLISGGCEGQVRLWDVCPTHQKLICTLKEHKGPVSAVHINCFDDEAASASTDGTVIIWDVIRQTRKQILFANTLFMCVKYYPTGIQILTGGTDRKLTYWEVIDGSLVRELEGSPTGALNALDMSYEGSLFVTGGNDQVVKLWKYQEGITTHIGLGHSAVITAICFSPCGQYIVSTSASGSIFIWKNPYDLTKSQEFEYNEGGELEPGEESIMSLPKMAEEPQALKKCYCPFRIKVRRPVGKNLPGNIKC